MRSILILSVSIWLLMINLILFLASCSPSFNVNVPKDINLSLTKTKTIPLTVGLYAKADLKKYKFVKREPYEFRPLYISIGDAIKSGIDKVSNIAFKEVKTLNSIDDGKSSSDIQAIVIPEIVGSDLILTGRNYSCLVKMKWTVLDKNGKELFLKTILGEGISGIGYTRWGSEENLNKCMKSAVEDCFQKTYNSIIHIDWWRAIEKPGK